MIPAILLAAGASRRMGTPKALLRVYEKSFIRYIIDVLAASRVSSTVVVLGAEADVIKAEIAGTNVHTVVNEQYESGQLSSIRTGIEAVRSLKPDAILVQPVDYPLVRQSTINALIDRFIAASPPVVVPIHDGKKGHPVIFSGAVLEELQIAPAHLGARAVVWSHAGEVAEVEVADEGVLVHIDTPSEYERLLRYLRTTPQ